jgi:hypothetical protein
MPEMEIKTIMTTIIQKPIGRNCGFTSQLYKPTWFVVHFTGGTPNLQSLYNYWLSQCGIGSNSHFGIERTTNQYAKAGDIWQFLPLTDGACANCCLEDGAAPFLPRGVNLNVRTVSCEGINPDTGNNGDMPTAQFDAYAYLIRTVCNQLSIPTNIIYEYWNGYENTRTWGNASGGIIMHRDIAPPSRRMCPGTPYYSGQMQKLINAVNGGSSMSVWQPPQRDTWIIQRWEAYGQSSGTTIPKRDTGIFTFWRNLLLNDNIDMGSPLGIEVNYDTTWVVQYFESGSIFWNKSKYEIHAMTGGGPRA